MKRTLALLFILTAQLAFSQTRECLPLTIDTALYKYLAGLREAPDSCRGYKIFEDTYGPIDFYGSCLLLAVGVKQYT